MISLITTSKSPSSFDRLEAVLCCPRVLLRSEGLYDEIRLTVKGSLLASNCRARAIPAPALDPPNSKKMEPFTPLSERSPTNPKRISPQKKLDEQGGIRTHALSNYGIQRRKALHLPKRSAILSQVNFTDQFN